MAPAAREPGQKGVNYTNLLVGSVMNIAEVTSLGQPFEVLKTQMAANRSQRLPEAARTVWSRGGVFGFYQGLIPWVRSLSFSHHQAGHWLAGGRSSRPPPQTAPYPTPHPTREHLDC